MTLGPSAVPPNDRNNEGGNPFSPDQRPQMPLVTSAVRYAALHQRAIATLQQAGMNQVLLLAGEDKVAVAKPFDLEGQRTFVVPFMAVRNAQTVRNGQTASPLLSEFVYGFVLPELDGVDFVLRRAPVSLVSVLRGFLLAAQVDVYEQGFADQVVDYVMNPRDPELQWVRQRLQKGLSGEALYDAMTEPFVISDSIRTLVGNSLVISPQDLVSSFEAGLLADNECLRAWREVGATFALTYGSPRAETLHLYYALREPVDDNLCDGFSAAIDFVESVHGIRQKMGDRLNGILPEIEALPRRLNIVDDSDRGEYGEKVSNIKAALEGLAQLKGNAEILRFKERQGKLTPTSVFQDFDCALRGVKILGSGLLTLAHTLYSTAAAGDPADADVSRIKALGQICESELRDFNASMQSYLGEHYYS